MDNNTGILNNEITEANFINLANNMIGTGLLPTGKANYELAKDYAQQQERVAAIAFAEWLNSKAYNSYDSNGKNCGWNLHDGMDGNIYTTDQLYELYLKQTNQKAI